MAVSHSKRRRDGQIALIMEETTHVEIQPRSPPPPVDFPNNFTSDPLRPRCNKKLHAPDDIAIVWQYL